MSTKPAPKRGGAPQQNGGPREGAKQANPGQQRSQQARKGGKKPDTALFVVEEPFTTQKKEPANLSKNNRPAAENAKEVPTKGQQKPVHAEGDQEKQLQQKHQQKGQGKGNDRGHQNQRHQQEKGAQQPQQNGTAPGYKHSEGKGEEADPQTEKQEAPERKVSVAQQERQRLQEINDSLDKLEAELVPLTLFLQIRIPHPLAQSLINLETMSHSVATSDLRSAIQEKREQGAEVGNKVRSLQKEKGELNKKRMEAEGLKKKRVRFYLSLLIFSVRPLMILWYRTRPSKR